MQLIHSKATGCILRDACDHSLANETSVGRDSLISSGRCNRNRISCYKKSEKRVAHPKGCPIAVAIGLALEDRVDGEQLEANGAGHQAPAVCRD